MSVRRWGENTSDCIRKCDDMKPHSPNRLSNHIVWVPQRLDGVIFGFSKDHLDRNTCKRHLELLSPLSQLESPHQPPPPPVPASIKAADWLWTARKMKAEWKRCLLARWMRENHGESVTFPLKRRCLGSVVQVSWKHHWWAGYCSERRGDPACGDFCLNSEFGSSNDSTSPPSGFVLWFFWGELWGFRGRSKLVNTILCNFAPPYVRKELGWNYFFCICVVYHRGFLHKKCFSRECVHVPIRLLTPMPAFLPVAQI